MDKEPFYIHRQSVCPDPATLLKSRFFKDVLNDFNRQKKEENDDWENINVWEVVLNPDIAQELYKYWNEKFDPKFIEVRDDAEAERLKGDLARIVDATLDRIKELMTMASFFDRVNVAPIPSDTDHKVARVLAKAADDGEDFILGKDLKVRAECYVGLTASIERLNRILPRIGIRIEKQKAKKGLHKGKIMYKIVWT